MLLVATGLVWPASVFSQDTRPVLSFITGDQLYEYCTTPSAPQQAVCAYYVMGMADVLMDMTKICPEKGVTGSQLADVVTNYFRAHPEVRHLSASSEGRFALEQAFPCK